MSQSPVIVIGAGMAGMAAARTLADARVAVEVYDPRRSWGGHTTSIERDGFVFDEGPHVSFAKDPAVVSLFERGAGSWIEFQAKITNAFRGHWITHPAQCHLHGLDPDLVTRCVTDFVRAQMAPPEVRTYADWCVAMFGQTFAETFPFAYTRKYWTVEAERMSTDWVGARIYPPRLEEVIRGALQPHHEGDFHYLKSFRYPKQGGFQSFMRDLVVPDVLRMGLGVVGVDLAARIVTLADGSRRAFSQLISTMPMPDLVAAIPPDQVPDEVRAAASRLLCSSVVLVDVAVDRRDLFDHHWFYVYDEDLLISRGYFPHMLSPENAPDGCGAIQLEVYYSKHRPLPVPLDEVADRVVDELLQLRILRSRDEVRWTRSRDVRYANVVFDHDRAAAVATITEWLTSRQVLLAGRYGEWSYAWTDDAVKAGWKAAAAALDGERRSLHA